MSTQTFHIRTLITVLALLLSGFKAPTHHHPTISNREKKAPEAPVPVSAPAAPPLDLSIPFKTPDNSNATSAIIDDDPTIFNGLFAAPPQIGEGPLQLKGGWINSPEPEIEKRKSVDGASIMINIKE